MNRKVLIACAAAIGLAGGGYVLGTRMAPGSNADQDAVDAPTTTWQIKPQTDPLDDKTLIVASVLGDGGVFKLICNTNGLEESLWYQVGYDAYLGIRGPVPTEIRKVEYRVDSRPTAETDAWYTKSDVSIVDDKVVETLAAELRGASRLVVAAYDFEGRRQIASFDLDGLTGVMDQLRTDCAKKAGSGTAARMQEQIDRVMIMSSKYDN